VSFCPECEAAIEEEFDEVGDLFTCPECGVELEVTSIDPLDFDLAPLEEDDDNDDEDLGLDETDEEEDWDEDDALDEDENKEEGEY